MTEHGLNVKALYSSISDQELDYIAGQIKHDFPNCGHRMMQGHLLRQGHRIQHARIRDCLQVLQLDGPQLSRDENIRCRHLSHFGTSMATIN